MTAFIIRRILICIPVLLGVTLLTFLIVNARGNPLAALAINPKYRTEDIERMRANMGLDEPVMVRYGIWLKSLARGDLGLSMKNSTPVTTRLFDVLPNTLILTASAFFFALICSIPLGILSAIKRNTWFDHVTTVLTTAAFAMPAFWLALLLILVFASGFREWGLPSLPVSGMVDRRGGGDFLDRFTHLILPVVALAIGDLAGWTRYIRGQMLEVIRQDYVQTARAKGLRERAVLYGHAFRNALLPLVTLVGLSLPGLVGGAFIIETVFAWPGLGRLAVDAARSSDYTVIMGVVLMGSVLVLIANLLSDIMYALLDPRIRYS